MQKSSRCQIKARLNAANAGPPGEADGLPRAAFLLETSGEQLPSWDFADMGCKIDGTQEAPAEAGRQEERYAVRKTENLYGDRQSGLSPDRGHPPQSGPTPKDFSGGGAGGTGGIHPTAWDFAAAVCAPGGHGL